MFIYDASYNSLKETDSSDLSVFCKAEKVDLEYLVYTLKTTKKSSRK